MKKVVALALALLLTMPLLPACDVMGALKITPLPTPKLSPLPTPAQTPMPTPSPAPTPTPTPMPEPTPTPTPEPTPSPSPSPSLPPPVVIKFKDRVVEKVIRAILNQPKGPVTDQDMLKVWNFKFDYNEVKAYGGKIKTLDDLRWCVNLRRVILFDTNIKSISALSGTRDLVEFQCQDKLKDFTPLLANKNLEIISLSGVTDGFFKKLIGNCEMLNSVYLHQSTISSQSIRLLAKKCKISSLSMTICGITDASPFAGFTGLNYFSLEKNNIKDISALAENPNLSQYIDLSANKITDWSPLENMTLLRTLSVRDNPVIESPVLDKLEKNGCTIYR